jgi:urease accessory protein
MMRATRIVRKSEAVVAIVADTVTLDRAARYKRRIAMTSDGGISFLLDLPEATYMADGDAIVLDDGRLVGVRAAPEPLLEVHAPDAAALARIAWHIGNRHTPAEVTSGALYIQPDHVLEEMLIGLGAHVHHVSRPFEPEGGAYGGKGRLERGHHHGAATGDHGHDHSHDHTHDLARVEKPRVWRPE